MNNSFMAVNIMVHLGNKRIKKNLEKDDIFVTVSQVTNNINSEILKYWRKNV